MSYGGMPVGGGAGIEPTEAADGRGGAWSQEAVGPAAGEADPNVDAAFKLQVEEGSTVSATFPFFGDPEGGQLSFQIGDHIKVNGVWRERKWDDG